MIKIELSESETELFKLFRKYQSDFEFLLKGGFFEFRGGQAIVNRDSGGVLKNIQIKTTTFVRKKGGA